MVVVFVVVVVADVTAVGYWWLVACGCLFVVRCWLLRVGCLLIVVTCSVVGCFLLFIGCSLFVGSLVGWLVGSLVRSVIGCLFSWGVVCRVWRCCCGSCC